jgi:hypothetical protein
VNASQFLELIEHANFLEENEVLLLKKAQSNFPYFQIPHVLAARYEFLENGCVQADTLAKAAVTSPDRIWLKNFIEELVSNQARSLEKDLGQDLLPETKTKEASMAEQTEKLKRLDEDLRESSQETDEKNIAPEAKTRVRRKSHVDDLIETIKRKEKKEILDEKKKEQIDLIKAFSKKSIKLATINEIDAIQNTENLAAESTKISDKMVSESLAKILVSQGKFKMAKEIYQKLILKFPDKRAFFTELIDNLKE